MKIYDLVIIGAGPAGTLAAKTVASKGMSVLVIERGQDLTKRRDLLSGWFGAGLYRLNRIETIDPLLNNSKATNEIFKLIKKIAGPAVKIYKQEEVCHMPEQVGRDVATYLFHSISSKADVLFNTKVIDIKRKNNFYEIGTSQEKYRSKRCLISTGSNSMEWLNVVCAELKITPLIPSSIKVGVRVEVPAFRAEKIIRKEGDIKIQTDEVKSGDARPNAFVGEIEEENILSAFSHIVPEKISRKTNFMVGFEMSDTEETIRKTRIINVLSNDRIKKERIADYMIGKTILKHFKEFEVLKDAFKEVDKILPSFSSYAIMYVPEIRLSGILPVDNEMRISTNLFGAGECTCRVSNIIGAMASGTIAARTILKE